MRLRRPAVVAVLAFALVSIARAADEPKAPDSFPAVTAMTKWLHVIDAAKYSESWEEASSYFRRAVPRERWIEGMEGTRKPLGDLVKRYIKSADYRTSLPGAPDGQYFVIQFGASFSGKADAVETVTAVREGGAWKAAGYFIK